MTSAASATSPLLGPVAPLAPVVAELFRSGGPLMVPLTLLGGALFFLLVRRGQLLFRAARAPVSMDALGGGPRDPRVVLHGRLMGLQRHRALTAAMVAVAPLLGLLGTVRGMMQTFAALADTTAASQAAGIAAGVAEALVTTEFGLAIAVPGLVGHALIERFAGRLARETTAALEHVGAALDEGAGGRDT